MVTNWSDAERTAAAWMHAWGYEDARTGRGGADGGVDVTSRSALAQVKHTSAPTGRPALQRFVGARAHRTVQLLFFSSAGYSRPALAYAQRMDIALFQLSGTRQVHPVNEQAAGVLRAAAARRPPSAPRAPRVPRRKRPRARWLRGLRG